MTHLSGEQLVAFFSVFAARYVEEDAEHNAIHDALVSAVTACRNPANIISDHDAEIDFIGAGNGTRGGERRSNPVAVGGVDVRGKFLEGDASAHGTPHKSKARSSIVKQSLSTCHDHNATLAASIANLRCFGRQTCDAGPCADKFISPAV